MQKVLEISKFQFSSETFSVPAAELGAQHQHQIRPHASSQRGAYHPGNMKDTQMEAVTKLWQWKCADTQNVCS